MKPKLLKWIILLLLVTSFGCSAINELTQDEIGQPISTITNSMGPPTRVIPDGKGGSIYIWEQRIPTGWHNNELRTNTYFVDSNGIIYQWR